MTDQQQQQPIYSTLDAMIADDAKRKAVKDQPKSGSSSIPSQVVLGGATAHDDEGVSLLSMPTALQSLTHNTTHDKATYPNSNRNQASGQSSMDANLPINNPQQQQQQQQATGESSQAIEIKLKGATTDDGTITSPITPKRTGGGPTPKQATNLPALTVIPTTTTVTNTANTEKGHVRHPSSNYFDDGEFAPNFPNRSQRSLEERVPKGVTPTTGNNIPPMTTTTTTQPIMPPPASQPTDDPANTNRPYIHTTYIRDSNNFAANEEPLGPIDDLRIPLGLSSAPPSPVEDNPQQTGMGLNYSDDNRRRGNDQNSAWRRYIIIVIALLAIGAIAFAIVILVEGGGEEQEVKSPGIDFIPPERTPVPTVVAPPTMAPSTSPTEIIVYDPPSEEDCQAVLSGRAVPGQVNLIERLYEIPFDIVIKEGTELIGFLNQFLEGMRTIVVPDLTQCQEERRRTLRGLQQRRQLRDISNVVANAIVSGEYSDDPCSNVEENAFCQRIVVTFLLYLKGDERNLDIAVLIRNAISGTDGSSGDASLLSRFGLDGKAESVQATEVINLNPTESPSSSPTNLPSVKPSFRPTNIPSVFPSPSPSAFPTTSMPSRSPTASPSHAPSSQPSCSDTASWFNTEINSTPLRTGGLVTYSLKCADQVDGIAVLVWDGSDKCSTKCLGYLTQADSDGTCVTSSQFIVSFNVPAELDVPSLNFLVGTMDPITAGSLSLACPGSILASESPSSIPSAAPTQLPSIEPSTLPSTVPSLEPSMVPSVIPSMRPSVLPSTAPSKTPTNAPSESPSMRPSESPSSVPSVLPTVKASGSPSSKPSSAPSVLPTVKASGSPSSKPSSAPSVLPTIKASGSPSSKPSSAPSARPSTTPSFPPTVKASALPSSKPSSAPSSTPSRAPSKAPSNGPTLQASVVPTSLPSTNPTGGATMAPSKHPSLGPTGIPSTTPSSVPSLAPNPVPTVAPITNPPTKSPTSDPTSAPTLAPSSNPSSNPSTSNSPSATP